MAGKKRKHQAARPTSGSDSFVPPPTHPNTVQSHSSLPTLSTPTTGPTPSSSTGHVPSTPITNSDYSESTQKIFILSRGDEFSEESLCARSIGKIIKQSFHGAWKSWTKIPKEVRNMWFKEFEKEYCWHDENNMEIKKIFEHRGSIILKNKLHRAHKDNQRPEWIGENAWNDLLEKWQEENFQKISTQNKANRASDCGGRGFPLHQGGSISYLAHKDKLEKELGHTPGLAETFMRTHSSLNDKGERAWVDDCAKNTYNMFKEKWDALSSQSSNEGGEESQQNMPSELQVWVETVGGVKKGRCYGVAGEASFLKGPSSSQGSSAQYAKHQKLEKEIDSLRIANEKLTEKMEKMTSDFESHVQSFHQMFQSMQHFTAHAPYHPHAPYPPVPHQSPHPLGPGNQSQYYPPSSFGFMPPPYLSRPEVTQNVPSSSKSHNQNEQENDDSDQEDGV